MVKFTKPRVIISIKGGMVQSVFTSKDIDPDIDVLNFDDLEQETKQSAIDRLKRLEKECNSLDAVY